MHVGAILGDENPEGWAEDLAVPSGWHPNLRVIPSARNVSNREADRADHAELRLKTSLTGLQADVVVIDCPNRQGGPVSVPGRMEHIDLGPGWSTVIVDFAHTPDALLASGAALRTRTPGQLVVTASSGGDRDPTKREPAGTAAVDSGADVVLVTDDNPRTEDPAAIRAAVLR